MGKKLANLCMVISVFGLMAGSAFAQAPYLAGAGTMSLDVGSCETRTVSLDGSTFGTSKLVSGGVIITLSDPTKLSITGSECYDGELTPAVWDPGSVKIDAPVGFPGGYAVLTSNLGAGVTPSANILICTVEFCGTASGASVITIDTVPENATWVAQNFTVYDSTIDAATITVSVSGGVTTTTTSVAPTTTTTSVEPTTTTTSVAPTTTTTSVEPTTTTTSIPVAASYKAGAATMSLSSDGPTCETRTVSVDGSSFGTSPLVSGGVLITLSDPTRVAITSAECYDGELTPAVWDPGSVKIDAPVGFPGGYAVVTSNLGAGVTPSSNILICDVEFCGAGAGSCTITIDTIPENATWVNQSFAVFDSTISPAIIDVTVTGEPVCGNGAVEGDEECDGGVCCTAGCTFEPLGTPCLDETYCNGEETCDGAGVCQAGTPVECDDGIGCTTTDYCDEGIDGCINGLDDSFCEDRLFCNGVETCDPEDVNADPVTGCVSGTPVECPDNGLYCDGTEFCDEDANECAATGNPCPSEARVCIEITDECIAPTCSITVEPTEETVDVLGTVTFNVVVDGTCYYEPSYTWDISSTEWTGCTGGTGGSAIGSTIDATGQYTAGTRGGTDYIRVTDIDNGEICDYAEVTVIGPTSTTTTSIRPSTTTTTPTTTTTVESTTTTTSIVSSTTTTSIGPTASIEVKPSSVFQSRWFFLPGLLRIEGTDTNFVRRQTTVTFQPDNALLKFPPVVFDSDTILMWVVIMPSLMTGEIDNVVVTATTGSESPSGNLEIQLLPFFLEEKN